MMEKHGGAEMERSNRTVMFCHTMEAVVIAGTFLIKVLQGSRTFGYFLIAAVLILGPVIAEWIAWGKDHESLLIKHFASYGFGISYIFLMLTMTNQIVFIYAIPMIMAIQVYHDVAYSLKVNICAVIMTLITVIGGITAGAFGYNGMENALMQVFSMVLIAAYSYLISRALGENTEDKIHETRDAQAKVEGMLAKVSAVNSKMQAGVEEIHERVGALEATSDNTRTAMEGVSSGATETAEAVQRQLEQTEAIQQMVGQVDRAVRSITESMNQTLDILAAGNENMDCLVAEVDASVRSSEDVADKLETLDKYIVEMNSIVEIISGVTEQTSLLSLNASIEAARAGEAGRGFAVVATEISSMATQTQDATVHIAELIGNISNAIGQVVRVVRGMIDEIDSQKAATTKTAVSFGSIEKNTHTIRDNVAGLSASVKELKTANDGIVDSIQTISAISEEVSAHANETLGAEQANMANLDVIANMIQELFELITQE